MANSQHAAFLVAMDKLEPSLKSQIVTDKNDFIEKASKRYAEHGAVNFFDLVHKHQEQVFATLRQHYPKIVKVFGTMALATVKTKSFKDSDEDSLFVDLANDWIHTEGLKRSKSIADTTEGDVLSIISDGLDAGLGTAAIASSIMDVTDLSSGRADLIARTEVHAAANYASIESVRDAQDKLGVKMLKQWSPTADSRTRPAHAQMEGSDFIPEDQPFIVEGEQMDRPGDPAGSPDNTINCRCVVVFEESKQ